MLNYFALKPAQIARVYKLLCKENYKKVLLCLLIIIGSVKNVDAQNANLVKLSPAQPSSTGLGKFDDIPVDLHTGIASVNIPLINISISGFNLPISIGYHGAGIKTEDVASNVGLGWALSAGGQINKIVVKYPDEGLTPEGHVHDTIPTIEDGFGNRLGRNPANGNNWKYKDDEPDQYRVNGPGISCKFNNLLVNSPKDRTKVERLSDASFKITNTQGIQYYFGGKINTGSTIKAIEDSTVYYLTQIELVNGSKINFEYEKVNIETIPAYGKEYHYLPTDNNIQRLVDDGLTDIWNNTRSNSTYRISNIVYPGGKLQFSYEKKRKDLAGASMLSGIRQFDLAGTFMRKTKDIRFYQSYFECNSFEVRLNPTLDPKYSALFYRLRLDSVSSGSLVHPQTHAFLYNETEMPEQGSLSQDHWGYYNGSPNQSLIPPYSLVHDAGTLLQHTDFSSYSDRRCNETLAQAGILKKIIYPQGGSTSFEYELNTAAAPFPGYVSYNNTLEQHLTFRTKMLPIPPSLGVASAERFAGTNFVVNSSGTENNIKGERITFNFRKGAKNQSVFIAFNLIPLAAGNAALKVAPFDTVVTISASHMTGGQPDPTVSFSRFLPNGIYRVAAAKVQRPLLAYLAPDGLSDMMVPAELSFSSGNPALNEGMAAGTPNNYPAGGLRIKKMVTYDGIDHARDMVQKFSYYTPGNTSVSSGSFGQLPEYREDNAILYVPKSTFQAQVGSHTEYYNFPVAFWDVMEIPVAGGSPKQIKYLDVRFESHQIEAPEYAASFTYEGNYFNVKMANSNRSSLKPLESYVGYTNVTVEYGENATGGKKELTYTNTGNDWKRGLLLKEKIFKNENGTFFPVSENTNQYDIDNNWYKMTGNIAKSYGIQDTSSTVLTKKYFTYSTPFLDIPSRTVSINSMGDSTVTEKKLVANFQGITQTNDLSLGIRKLYDKNMISIPVEETVYRQKVGSRGSLISTFTEYGVNTPYPKTMFSSEVLGKLTSFSPAFLNNGGVEKSSLYKPILKFNSYDASGNLEEQQKQDGAYYSYIWGNNKLQLLAEAINCKTGQVYFNSFEEAEGNFDSKAKAGLQSHTGNYTVNFSPVTPEPLKITYWAFNNNAWSFKSADYVQGMLLSGEKIDEIRIFPPYTQLTTYTYRLGVGLLSKCDSKNEYQYYEYDAEGRLIGIRNDSGSLVQTLQYQPKVVLSN